MTGEDFQYINAHAHGLGGGGGGGAPQMVEAGEGGFHHSQYSPKHAEANAGMSNSGGNPYYIADKTMTELSSLPAPYEQIDHVSDHVSTMNYEASAVAVPVGGMYASVVNFSVTISLKCAIFSIEDCILIGFIRQGGHVVAGHVHRSGE